MSLFALEHRRVIIASGRLSGVGDVNASSMTALLEAIVLAGGSSLRFGGDKRLAQYRGAPLIRFAIAAALAAPVTRVILATGPDDRLQEHMALIRDPRLTVVQARDAAEGLAATLRAAVMALAGETAGVFVFLGDMPKIPHDLAHILASKLAGHAAAAPFHRGVRGHPVLVSRELFDTLGRLAGDRGAGSVLDRLGDRLARVDVEDEGIVFDVDHRADLKR
jgi:molybdenum cofactor cytidylyltransferase